MPVRFLSCPLPGTRADRLNSGFPRLLRRPRPASGVRCERGKTETVPQRRLWNSNCNHRENPPHRPRPEFVHPPPPQNHRFSSVLPNLNQMHRPAWNDFSTAPSRIQRGFLDFSFSFPLSSKRIRIHIRQPTVFPAPLVKWYIPSLIFQTSLPPRN